MDRADQDKLLRLDAVMDLVGMKRSWILSKTKEGKFPKPLKLSPRAIAWRESHILAWINAQEISDQ